MFTKENIVLKFSHAVSFTSLTGKDGAPWET